ncbi:MAG TPA: hypothetical protein PL037_09800, partial [Elusimicrobiales bacterium]|nr:hypothetical protein [Elusimicrobiales bacterium]
MKYLLPALILALPLQRPAAQQTESGGSSYAHMSVQDLNRAAAELEASVRNGSSDIGLYIRLGFIYTRLEKADEAQRAFESAAGLDPRKAVVHYMLGLIYEKKGMTDRAIA